MVTVAWLQMAWPRHWVLSQGSMHTGKTINKRLPSRFFHLDGRPRRRQTCVQLLALYIRGVIMATREAGFPEVGVFHLCFIF